MMIGIVRQHGKRCLSSSLSSSSSSSSSLPKQILREPERKPIDWRLRLSTAILSFGCVSLVPEPYATSSCPEHSMVIQMKHLASFTTFPTFQEIREKLVPLKQVIENEREKRPVLFVSHTWEDGNAVHAANKLAVLRSNLCGDTYVWIDQICIDQQDLQQKKQAIRDLDLTLFHCDHTLSLMTPSYEKRCWCVYERWLGVVSAERKLTVTSSLVECAMESLIAFNQFPLKFLESLSLYIHLLSSEATLKEDKKRILSRIQTHIVYLLAAPTTAWVCTTLARTSKMTAWAFCSASLAVMQMLPPRLAMPKHRFKSDWASDLNYGFNGEHLTFRGHGYEDTPENRYYLEIPQDAVLRPRYYLPKSIDVSGKEWRKKWI